MTGLCHLAGFDFGFEELEDIDGSQGILFETVCLVS